MNSTCPSTSAWGCLTSWKSVTACVQSQHICSSSPLCISGKDLYVPAAAACVDLGVTVVDVSKMSILCVTQISLGRLQYVWTFREMSQFCDDKICCITYFAFQLSRLIQVQLPLCCFHNNITIQCNEFSLDYSTLNATLTNVFITNAILTYAHTVHQILTNKAWFNCKCTNTTLWLCVLQSQN